MNLDIKIAYLAALADETRVRILMLLTHGELRVDDLVQALGLPQSTVSRHLAYLRNSHVVRDRRYLNQVFYAIDAHDVTIAEIVLPLLNGLFTNERIPQADLARLRNRSLHFTQSPPDVHRVLFICIHNSARSQMAEAFLNAAAASTAAGAVEAESAGVIPASLQTLVIEAMREVGIDISAQRSKNLADLAETGRRFDTVITVCDESRLASCPAFPGVKTREHWDIPDPASATGSSEEKLAAIRLIRDEIQKRVAGLIERITII